LTRDTDAAVGLCASCRHARMQTTARGARYWRCLLAETDERFVRYLRLPVLACPGWERDPASPDR